MKNIARGLIALALATLVVDQGLGQTSSVSSGTFVGPANPVAYSWPSATISNPYPTLALPHCGAPGACAANEDDNGDLLKGDPLLDCSPWASGYGWFGALEVDAVGPSVANRLNGQVASGTVTSTVQLPSAELHWTAMPRVELGYRLGQGAGELSISYRGLWTSGTGTLANFDAAGNAAILNSHLDMNVIDIDYGSRENSLGPLWDMKWRAGVRIATIYFDSTAGTPLLSQRETNNFVGAGPHFGVELKRRISDTGFSVIGQLDGGVVLGRVHQEYDQAIANVGSGTAYATANEPAPVLELRFGVDYAPHFMPNLHLSTGYLFDRWWTVGETNGTQGEVTYQGVFFRGEWRY